MPAQVDLSKLSVRQFAERFKSEMIPLSNTFSYFCASVPLSEEDLKAELKANEWGNFTDMYAWKSEEIAGQLLKAAARSDTVNVSARDLEYIGG